jgi:hypothetical protein
MFVFLVEGKFLIFVPIVLVTNSINPYFYPNILQQFLTSQFFIVFYVDIMVELSMLYGIRPIG